LLCGVDASGEVVPLRVGVSVSPQPAGALRVAFKGEFRKRLRNFATLLCGVNADGAIVPMNT